MSSNPTSATSDLEINFDDYSREDLEKEVAKLRATVSGLQNAVTVEPISGLLKAHAFVERANDEYNRSRRYNRDMTLVVITFLDRKKVIEAHGDAAWDKYITSLAQMATSASRQGSDILGRVGQHQFALLLPESDMSGCHRFKERMKHQLSSTKVEWEGRLLKSGMKLSAGILLEQDTCFKDLYMRTLKQRLESAQRSEQAIA